ncbi:MAG TPA: AtpZ/AtpI family protein [Pseudomonadota bacterium]|nr:AtpZ/AtpI family protein [Pseudomonadota bacterium]
MYFQSLRYSYIGLFFGVAVVLGYAVGSALDRRFHTGSWCTLGGVLFGVASGFNELLRMARRYQKELARDAAAKNESPPKNL